MFELVDSRLIVKRNIPGQADLDWGIVAQVGVSDDVLTELGIVPFTFAEVDGRPVELAKTLDRKSVV